MDSGIFVILSKISIHMSIARNWSAVIILWLNIFYWASAQRTVIDSSFADFGWLHTTLRQTYEVNTILNSKQDIVVVTGDKLQFFDPTGNSLNLGSYPNPLNWTGSEGIYLMYGASLSEDSFLLLKYSSSIPRSVYEKVSVRRIHTSSLSDSSFFDKGKLVIGDEYIYSYTGNICNNTKDGDSFIVPKLLKGSQKEILEFVRVNNLNDIIRHELDVTEWCPNGDDLTYFHVSNIHYHPDDHFYAVVSYECFDSLGSYLLRFNNDMSLDSSFGMLGYYNLGRTARLNNEAILIEQIVSDKDGYLYMIYNDNLNKRILIEKRDQKGLLVDEFGDRGVLVISGYLFKMYHNWMNTAYNGSSNQLYFFAYDFIKNTSRLFVINTDGTMDKEYDKSGGFSIEGIVKNLSLMSGDCYLVTGSKHSQSPNTFYLVKYCNRLVSDVDETKNDMVDPYILHKNGELIIKDFGDDLQTIELYNLIGQKLSSFPITANQSEIILSYHEMTAGAYILSFKYKDGKIICKKVMDPR